MQITALIQVINYLKEISGDPSLLDRYLKLSQLVKNAAKSPESDFKAEILKEKHELCLFLMNNEPISWGYDSFSLYEKINEKRLFGKKAADHLMSLISPENKDYNSISADLSKTIKLLSRFSENLTRFRNLFELIVPSEVLQLTESTDNRSSLLLYFEGDLTVQNIADLERYSRLWNSILDTFHRLTGEDNFPLDISSFSKGNIVLGVAVEDRTLKALREGISGILSSMQDIVKIRKIQIELSRLQLDIRLNELLEEEIEHLISSAAYATAQNLITDSGYDTNAGNEIINEISRSLKQVLSFIERGGKIEFKTLSSDMESASTNKRLNESFLLAIELDQLNDELSVVDMPEDISEVTVVAEPFA